MNDHALRLFFGIDMSPQARQALAALVPPRTAPGANAFKWVEPSLYHVTLAFLGNTPTAALSDLGEVARRAAKSTGPFELRLGKPGSFGGRGGGAALWVGLEGDLRALHALQSSLITALQAALFDFDAKPFRPHITLARRRRDARPDPFTWPCKPVPPVRVGVTELVLFESRLSPAGPSYHSRGAFPLGDTDAAGAFESP